MRIHAAIISNVANVAIKISSQQVLMDFLWGIPLTERQINDLPGE